MTNRQVLVMTGAAGHMGADLRPLLRQGYDLRLAARGPLRPEPGESFRQGDLTDAAYCRHLVAGADGVLHLAGAVGPGLSFEQTLDGNYRALLVLLEACRRAGVPRFIFASSHHALGLHPADRLLADAAEPAPDGYYGLSKIFGEAACAMYARRYGLQVLAIRIGNADALCVDGRRERIWLSARDMVQLVGIGMTQAEPGFRVVPGVSQVADPVFDMAGAAVLGYRPQDHAADNRAPGFRPLADLPAADTAHVGGYFATLDLPPPEGFDP